MESWLRLSGQVWCRLQGKYEAAPAGDPAVRASEHAKDDERFCTFIRSLVVLVLVCVVVLVHAGVSMCSSTYEVLMNTENGVESGAGNEHGARASQSEIACEIARERDE